MDYVFVMSRTLFRVNPYSIVAWMSRNSLLEIWFFGGVRVQLQSLKKMELLKTFLPVSGICSPILANTWNEEILLNKTFPENRKLADVSPIFKKKD